MCILKDDNILDVGGIVFVGGLFYRCGAQYPLPQKISLLLFFPIVFIDGTTGTQCGKRYHAVLSGI